MKYKNKSYTESINGKKQNNYQNSKNHNKKNKLRYLSLFFFNFPSPKRYTNHC